MSRTGKESPPSGAGRDVKAEYEAELVSRTPSGNVRQTTTGGPKSTAAWLRALADEIDPVKAAKPTCRCGTARAVPEPTGFITTNDGPRR